MHKSLGSLLWQKVNKDLADRKCYKNLLNKSCVGDEKIWRCYENKHLKKESKGRGD